MASPKVVCSFRYSLSICKGLFEVLFHRRYRRYVQIVVHHDSTESREASEAEAVFAFGSTEENYLLRLFLLLRKCIDMTDRQISPIIIS